MVQYMIFAGGYGGQNDQAFCGIIVRDFETRVQG
jgi:hypothetical protein